MEAIKFTLKTKTLELIKTPIPKIENEDDVLIKVAYSGICGTDLHILEGQFPVDATRALTLGHEYSGTVLDLGSGVTNVKVGDKVAVDPNNGCNCCHFCRSGNYHHCTDTHIGEKKKIGTFKDGGWAQYSLVSQHQVHKLPDNVILKQAALAEPLSCLTHGWDLITPLTVGQKILVLGAGIIGSLWVCALHLQGHRDVTVSEPNLTRLNLLKKLDTGYELATPDELHKNQRASGQLFDVVVDCSGHAPAVERAVTLLQRGGKLCCFGVAPIQAEIKIKPFDIYMKEMKIFGVRVNPFSFPKAIALIQAMGERYLNYEKLGIQIFRLKDYREAIEILKKGTIAKAIFQL